MFSWYKYLIVSLVFSHLGFWSGSLFLIAPFPDLCLLVLFYYLEKRPFVNVLSPHCQLIDGDNAFSYCKSLINGMDTFECSL